jgi:hypothetical protein
MLILRVTSREFTRFRCNEPRLLPLAPKPTPRPRGAGIASHQRMADKATKNEATASSSTCAARVGGHDDSHVHGPGCGHDKVAHYGHTDYVVDGQRHHPHEGHCDNHGTADRSE